MIITVLLYLLVSVPVLFYLLGWKLVGDKKAGWKLPEVDKQKFFWSVVGFALAFPLFLSGLGCSVFNVGVYIYSTAGRALGTTHGENYDVMFLFALIVSIPMLVAGYFGSRISWRKIKRCIKLESLSRIKRPMMRSDVVTIRGFV